MPLFTYFYVSVYNFLIKRMERIITSSKCDLDDTLKRWFFNNRIRKNKKIIISSNSENIDSRNSEFLWVCILFFFFGAPFFFTVMHNFLLRIILNSIHPPSVFCHMSKVFPSSTDCIFMHLCAQQKKN